MARQTYARPRLWVYGGIVPTTQGATGTLPDVDITLNNVNNNCLEQELPSGQKTVFCVVAGGSLP